MPVNSLIKNCFISSDAQYLVVAIIRSKSKQSTGKPVQFVTMSKSPSSACWSGTALSSASSMSARDALTWKNNNTITHCYRQEETHKHTRFQETTLWMFYTIEHDRLLFCGKNKINVVETEHKHFWYAQQKIRYNLKKLLCLHPHGLAVLCFK